MISIIVAFCYSREFDARYQSLFYVHPQGDFDPAIRVLDNSLTMHN